MGKGLKRTNRASKYLWEVYFCCFFFFFLFGLGFFCLVFFFGEFFFFLEGEGGVGGWRGGEGRSGSRNLSPPLLLT